MSQQPQFTIKIKTTRIVTEAWYQHVEASLFVGLDEVEKKDIALRLYKAQVGDWCGGPTPGESEEVGEVTVEERSLKKPSRGSSSVSESDSEDESEDEEFEDSEDEEKPAKGKKK